MSKWQSYSAIVLFCILIFGFAAATLIKPSEEFSETENRVLAQMPEIKAETILNGDFEANYEEYLTDQFIFRNRWIGLKTSVERLLLKRESKDIYFADNDYLIEKHTGVFTSDTAQRNIVSLAQFTEKYVEKFGTEHMSVMIVPNAVNILQSKLPPYASPYNEEEYLTKIAERLPEGIGVDISQILHEHTDEDIFYRTDHHWKTLAAFYVYQAWAKDRGYRVPELADYEIETVTGHF